MESVENKALFIVERILVQVRNDSYYELRSSIVHKSSVAGDEFARFFSAKDLPGHFFIDAGVDVRKHLTTAHMSLGSEKSIIMLKPQRQYWSDEAACNEHILHLRGQSGDLINHPVSLPGGNQLTLDTPWVFSMRKDGESYRLVATEDVRLPDQEVLIAVCKDWSVASITENTAVPTDFGILRVGKIERLLKRVTGTVKIENADNSWQIAVGKTSNLSSQFVPEGNRVALSTRPWPLFRGMPKIVSYDDDGNRYVLDQKDFKMFRIGSTTPLPSNIIPSPGLIELIIEKDGERLGRLRFGIIGKEAKEYYISSSDFAKGRIVLPGYMSVSFKWPGSRFDLKIQIPFPASGGRGYDEHDSPIPFESQIAIKRLLGKRILVFDSNPDGNTHYELELTLNPFSKLTPTLNPMPVKLENGSAEIRLMDYSQRIESLLGFSDDLDAYVDIALNVGLRRGFRLCVFRYDTELSKNENEVKLPIEFIRTITTEQLAQIEAAAVSLSEPGEPQCLKQQLLDDNPTGSWQIDQLSVQGSCLIIPSENSPVFFRPTLIQQDDESGTDQNLCTLAQAMMDWNAVTRGKAIAEALEAMSLDYTDSSWEFLNRIWLTFKHLPLCSLDVFRQLALRPDFAISVMFAPHPELCDLIYRLRKESELFTEIAPVSSWRKSISNLRIYYEHLTKESANEVFPIILGKRLDDLKKELDNHNLLLDILRKEYINETCEDLLHVIAAGSKNQDYFSKRLWFGSDALVQRYLLRVHGMDITWPEGTPRFHELRKILFTKLGNRSKDILGRYQNQFFCEKTTGFTLDVVNIPVICAIWMACDINSDWWQNPSYQYSLRILRAFDPVWFDECYRETIASCLTFGLFGENKKP